MPQGGDGISVEAAAEGSGSGGSGSHDAQQRAVMKLTSHEWCGRWAVPSSEFDGSLVGAKSLNTQRLKVHLNDEQRA